MKKLILCFSLIFAFSCSNSDVQEDVNNNLTETNTLQARTTPAVDDEIDQIFFDFVNSEEYMLSKSLMNDFSTNFLTNVTPSDFNTKEEMLSWIGNNIGQTTFNSVSEAELKWNEIHSWTVVKIANHPEYYDYLKNASLSSKIIYFKKWIVQPIVNNNDDCERELNDCETSAMNYYIQDYMHAAFYDGSTRDSAISYADYWYQNRISACGRNYRSCMGL
ncbi:hypothetical protein SAMN02927937_02931 [Paenimyroides aquimaris]|uniref:Lipoprotein n=1 Tax=Paenimyroides marinum TaxID=1159016 RepID=A0A1H6MRC1_9FLAO|nr:hypothetical protein [Paenimyroides aquimaris]SEI04472.1 hypothetical protein SAMN02927937_02931 [Paenimyroides aquimaris]